MSEEETKKGKAWALIEVIPETVNVFGLKFHRKEIWVLIAVLGFIFLCAIVSHGVIKGQVKGYAKEHAKEVCRYARGMGMTR